MLIPMLLLAVFSFVVVVSLMHLEERLERLAEERRVRFETEFPPISDDEFLALCKPGTSREVALKVRRIVSDQLCVEYDRIYPASRFVEDLGAD